jgi:hypothetical protein
LTTAEIVLTIILGLAVNEICAVSPWVADKLVRWSARHRDEDPARAEIHAEDQARLIEDCPSNLLKVLIALGFAAQSLVVLVHRVLHALVGHHRLRVAANNIRHPMNAVAVPGLTGLAVFFAGRKRVHLREEWRRHLVGDSDQGLAPKDQILAASGFLWAAVIMRFSDAGDVAWRPIDAMLSSRAVSSLFVWIPVLAAMLAIIHSDGLSGLIAQAQNLPVLGASLYALVTALRWYRK